MIAKDSLSANARGGTELMKKRLLNAVDASLLENFQIYFSRVEEPLDTEKIRILYCHDLPGDPASQVLANGGWKDFHSIVFVSNWQMQAYINYYQIPWSKCLVIRNAIEPLELKLKNKDQIRIGYWSTPHRGLQIIVPVFEAIAEKRSNVILDVYSSFKLYGWEQRDEPYRALFERCEAHPQINYHGSISNEELRSNISETHIFAYPSIWPETSCLCLIEAMSAGAACVHSNFGALYETAMNQTFMYNFTEDLNTHANMFANLLDLVIENYWTPQVQSKILMQRDLANEVYNLNRFNMSWLGHLNELIEQRDKGNLVLNPDRTMVTFTT